MKKILLFLGMVALLVLTACGGATSTTLPQGTIAPKNTLPPGQEACKVAGLLPDPDPRVPAVTDQDWIKGNKQAKITILEYSDFQ